LGLNVIHFRDIDVKQNLQGALDFIKDWVRENVKEQTHSNSMNIQNHTEREERTHPDFSTKNHPSQEGNRSSETYNGVKFKTVFKKDIFPKHPTLLELKKWCKIFHEKNLAPPYPGGSFGNLSFRSVSRKINFIITGTQIGMKDELSDEKFVEVTDCDFMKKIITVNGSRNPSSETMLHFAIYNKFPDVNAIFHGHSPELLSSSEKLRIPTTQEKEEYGTTELVDSVIQIMVNNNVVIMKEHGFIAVGKNMDETGNLVLNYLQNI
jgi:ribulose-5-phosphate 4-epimerase/fuculose-1-phosphate aldolase